MKRAVFATICLFCIVVWPSAAQISPDLLAMAPAGEVDRLITTREFEINKPFAGDMTLLSSACLNEDGREVVDALLAKGGDPNFKTYGGMTPLMYAASNRHGNVYCLKKLLSMGVAPNATDNRRRTALMFAATQRNPEFVRLLLAYGANVNARDSRGGTALFYAVRLNENVEVCRMLLAAGANVHARGNNANTILNEAAGSNRNPEITALLLRYGAGINAGNADYATPLIFAAKLNPNPEVVSLLLDKGANPLLRTRFESGIARNGSFRKAEKSFRALKKPSCEGLRLISKNKSGNKRHKTAENKCRAARIWRFEFCRAMYKTGYRQRRTF